MASVARKTTSANPPQSNSPNSAPTPQPNLVALRSAIFHSLVKIAGKEGDRDDLTPGSSHKCKLTVLAEIDGQRFSQSWDADLSVGHDSTRASSVGAPQEDVLAWVLRRVNAQTKAAVLREMAEQYAAAGNTFDVTEQERNEAKAALSKLRQKVSQEVRGTVRVNYQAAAAPLKIVG